jgi:membrane associated rhomboid family serine protease
MISLPVGLGNKWHTLPVATLSFISVLVLVFVFGKHQTPRETETKASEQLMVYHELLAYDICKKSGNSSVCNQIFLARDENQVAGAENVRRDWLEKTLTIFGKNPGSLKGLQHAQKFAASFEEMNSKNLKSKSRQNFNSENTSPPSVLASLFQHSTLFHLVANCLLILVFGSAIELWAGGLLFVVCFVVLGFTGATVYAKFVAPTAVEIWAINTAVFSIVGMFAAIFKDYYIKTIKISFSGPPKKSGKRAFGMIMFLLIFCELSMAALQLPAGKPTIGIYTIGLIFGWMAGFVIKMFITPKYSSLFSAVSKIYEEVNWERLSEFDIKLIRHALECDPYFLELRLRYFLSLDQVLAKDRKNIEMNCRRLKLLEEMGQDWSCFFATDRSRKTTMDRMHLLSAAFPWRTLFNLTSNRQKKHLRTQFTEEGFAEHITQHLGTTSVNPETMTA